MNRRNRCSPEFGSVEAQSMDGWASSFSATEQPPFCQKSRTVPGRDVFSSFTAAPRKPPALKVDQVGRRGLVVVITQLIL